jgi:uncharacterized membrane protein
MHVVRLVTAECCGIFIVIICFLKRRLSFVFGFCGLNVIENVYCCLLGCNVIQ